MGRLSSFAQHYPTSRMARRHTYGAFLDSQRGTVMLEFAASFGFVIFLCLSVISLGSVLDGYLRLTQVSDEAVRTLSALPGLDETEVRWSNFRENQGQQLENCIINPRGSNLCNHLLMQSRAAFLARTLGIDSDDADFDIISQFNLARDTVHVQIVGARIGVLLFLGELPVSIEAEGPYLY